MNKYVLKLYVTGQTSRSERAIMNLRHICDDKLRGKYEIVIIDVLQDPQIAEEDKIFVTPTLIREIPHPIRCIIGDLSDKEKVLTGLDIIEIGE